MSEEEDHREIDAQMLIELLEAALAFANQFNTRDERRAAAAEGDSFAVVVKLVPHPEILLTKYTKSGEGWVLARCSPHQF